MHNKLINKEDIDEVISRYLSGEASPEEAMFLDDWKEESPNNLSYFESCRKLFELTTGTSFLAADEQKAWNKISVLIDKEAIVKPLRTTRIYLRVAAALVVFLGIGFAIKLYFNEESPRLMVYKATTEEKKISLSDDSQITIAANSELSYDSDFGKTNRNIRLSGAAYFEVKHSEQIPFIIDAGDVYIKDIGTKFDVRSSKDTDTIYVKVDEGIVLLFDSAGTELLIKATEKAVYIRSTKKIIKEEKIEPEELPELNFNARKLGSVILELKEKYHINIWIENSEINNCLITTQFNKEPLETVLGVITETLGLTYQKTDQGYVIKGKKCDQ